MKNKKFRIARALVGKVVSVVAHAARAGVITVFLRRRSAQKEVWLCRHDLVWVGIYTRMMFNRSHK
jgi:hypothetical protein